MKKFRTVLLWSRINQERHESLTDEEGRIIGTIPLIETLFPGINYYSISGFAKVMINLGEPALKKQFPELVGLPAAAVNPDEERDVAEVLPTGGYEWQDSPTWQEKFIQKLAAA